MLGLGQPLLNLPTDQHLGVSNLFMEHYSLDLIRQLANLSWINLRFEPVKQDDKSTVRRFNAIRGDDLLVDWSHPLILTAFSM